MGEGRPWSSLSPTPHPAREEEQFVYLGLQESFPPPCSPWPLLPALPLLRAPAQSRRQRPPPILFSLPGLPLHPTPPALPPLPLGTRPWGREREALCPPGGPAQPRDRPVPPALPPPPPQATSAVRGRTRVPESSRELLAYKQEAPNHGHSGFFSRLYPELGRDRRIDCSWGTQVAPVFIAVPQPPLYPRPQSWEVHLATPRLE